MGWTILANAPDKETVRVALDEAIEEKTKYLSEDTLSLVETIAGQVADVIEEGFMGEGPFNINLGGNDNVSYFVNMVSRSKERRSE